MNSEIEGIFIDTFFIKEKKDRAKYELSSKKKRRDFVWKISEKYIRGECLSKLDGPIESSESVFKYLVKKGYPKECYVLSIDENIDGKTLPLSTALCQIVGYGPALILCGYGKLGYLECEQSQGAPLRFLIKK